MNRREFLSKIGMGVPAVAGGMILGISDKAEAGDKPKAGRRTFTGKTGLSYLEDGGCVIECRVSMSDAYFEELFQGLKNAGKLYNRNEVREVVEHALRYESADSIRYKLLVPTANHVDFDNKWPYWKRIEDIREKKRIRKKQIEIMGDIPTGDFYKKLDKVNAVGADFKWT